MDGVRGGNAAYSLPRITRPPIIDGDRITIGTMYLANGLEFRAVAVMACDEDILPDQERVESVTDIEGLDEVIRTERHLFHTACTRARDFLWVSGVELVSGFLDDLKNP